jgi:hypothetical protein
MNRTWGMNLSKRLAPALLALLLLAAGALYAQFSTGSYTPHTPGSIQQTLPPAASPDAVYDVGAYASHPPALLPGDGRQDAEAYCNTCHSPIYIPMQPPLPAATWAAEVDKMEKTYGAQLPDDVRQRIVRYLQANYTPETRKR